MTPPLLTLGAVLLGRIEAGRPDRKIVFSAGGRWEAGCPGQVGREPGRATVESDFSVEREFWLLWFWLL
jgi:hypothetical protein